MKEAVIVLESGKVFKGNIFGCDDKDSFGEVVFNTSLSGYQEVLTDPSYKGQIVAMTYPLIGNYGVNGEDVESDKVHVSGFIVRELCRYPSNYRSEKSLEEYLSENGITGMTEVDTRALTRHIRQEGAMRGVISTKCDRVADLLGEVRSSRSLVGVDMVKEVTCRESELFSEKGEIEIAVLDCGVKRNILRSLAERGCRVRVFPAETSAEDLLASKPDGILLSNGPGDPEGAPYVVETVKRLLGKKPLFGICLGNQMLALALGGRTYKLKFGHHGGNQPVKDLKTGRVSITAQNHNFCVDTGSLKGKDIVITHVNLNDDTVEGVMSEKSDFFGVQFHPEAGPGPNDAAYLFDRFINKVRERVG